MTGYVYMYVLRNRNCSEKIDTLTLIYGLLCSPGTQNQTTTVVNLQDGAVLCQKHTNGELVPQLMVWILAVGLSCALLSTLLAVYLQLGNPTREMVFWIGMMPGILLFGTGTMHDALVLMDTLPLFVALT